MRTFISSLMALAFISAPGLAADKKTDKVKMDDDVKQATAKALEWLASKQGNDGSFSDSRYPVNPAITGFAMLAFMSQGNVPNEGKYGTVVSKAGRFLIAAQRDDGYICARGGQGNMYCHGMATLALSQLFGMTGEEEVKKALKKAVDLTIRAQSPDGGWRYQPTPSGSDISVTIMQVMALRGAKDSGLHVPDKVMKKALQYINTCYDEPTGGYTYLPHDRNPGFARTAAGICVLKLCGEYDKKIDRSVEFLKQSMVNVQQHYWYGHYYASHAMHQVGGKEWEDHYASIKKSFLKMQSDNGSWSRPDPMSAGPVYQTAIAVIALSIPANYLPIFQR